LSLKSQSACFAAALISFIIIPLKADVPVPPAAPPVPSGYCGTIANELSGDLSAFNLLLKIPPTWRPIPGNPTLFAANLSMSDSNTGPGISGQYYMNSVDTQLQDLKAEGIHAVLVTVGFPVLYEPFYGSSSKMAPYVAFYQQVASAVRAAGLKLIVENNVLLSNDIESGWTNLSSFYATFNNNWNGYIAARAQMAATVAQTLQPDYLVVAEEPDGEATQTGQTNLQIPSDAAQMINAELTAVRSANPPVPNVKLGAGFGNWQPNSPSSLLDYTTTYVTLPLDYIDFHVYPVNTEATGSFIDNTLLIASTAALAGKPVAISEAFLWKMENSEWNVQNGQYYRARQPFSFWGPLDATFMQTMASLAKYTNMIYMAPEGPQYLFAYQTYGGTSTNGGAATCTCTTTSCSEATIVQSENSLSTAANQVSQYSTLGISYHTQLVEPPDTVPPSTPGGLAGTAGYTGATITWKASTDNVGVAGYNVYRCSPPAAGQSCTAVKIADTSISSFVDSGLKSGTPYNYQIQAFDLANNNSAISQVVSITTYRTSSSSPTNLVATVVSPKEITLTWSPPSDTSGLHEYLIFGGTTSSNLSQIGAVSSTQTSFTNYPLAPSTNYFYGVEAVESGVDSPMSPIVWATTMPLPETPSNVTATASSSSKIVVAWQESTAGGGLPVSYYEVYQGTSPTQLSQIARTTSTTFNNYSLTAGKKYYYQIVAVDTSNSASPPSSVVSATTL